jgi:phospholipid/cholesterol/gamma-HCH transport system substrate-binding protein
LGERVPSQKQLKWSQLKVGITVVAASITLAVLIFLMSNTGGLFTPKIIIRSYFDNAGGLRRGAPVRLEGVDIGNVDSIRVVTDPKRKRSPVEVRMKVTTRYISSIHKDSITALSTAGVLGETYIDIDSSRAQLASVQDGDELPAENVPDFQDVVRASQGTLQNLDALEKRVDRILAFVESGNGSVGKLIYDPSLYNNLASTVREFQGLVNDVGNGKGSIGKLISDDELYRKVNGTIDKLNSMIDDLNAGKGSAGKFLKDEALYKSANETIANVKQLTDDINAGKGAIGKLAKDQEFANKLQNTMNKISDLTNQLAAGQGTLGKLLQDPGLYNNTNQMLMETRELVKSIREDPKKYLTFRVKVF